MQILRIAFRNLNRQKKRSFLLGGAIAFGLLIISLVNTFTGGFVVNVKENVSHFMAGHIFISGYEKSVSGRLINVLRDDTALLAAIGKSGKTKIRYIARRSTLSGNLIFEGESIAQNVVGVVWEEERYLKERLVLRAGSLDDLLAEPRGLVLNEKMAERLNVQLGDTLLVQLKTITGQQNVGEFVLAATSVDSGMFSTISAYAHREHINRLIDIPVDQYITLGLFLDDLASVDAEADRIYRELEQEIPLFPRMAGPESFMRMRQTMTESEWEGSKYQLSTINEFLEPVNQIAAVLNTVGMVVVLILFVIIMVGITNTFRMIMYERTREIGTMRTLGMQRRQVRRLFLAEALLLSLGGVAVGLLLATVIAVILSSINWGTDNQFFILLDNGHLFFKVEGLQVLGNIVAVAALTLLAALFPARKAARLEPASALRKTY